MGLFRDTTALPGQTSWLPGHNTLMMIPFIIASTLPVPSLTLTDYIIFMAMAVLHTHRNILYPGRETTAVPIDQARTASGQCQIHQCKHYREERQ